jgi:hypothetical protein
VHHLHHSPSHSAPPDPLHASPPHHIIPIPHLPVHHLHHSQNPPPLSDD